MEATPAGVLTAGLEALISGTTDAARAVAQELANSEPISRGRTPGDMISGLSDMLVRAGTVAGQRLAQVPASVTDQIYEQIDDQRYRGRTSRSYGRDHSDWSNDDNHASSRHRLRSRYRASSLSSAEQHILDLVDDYLDRIPADGAKLTSVVDHVVLDTDYDPDVVHSVVTRHYVIHGPVISGRFDIKLEHRMLDTVADWMSDVLKEYGYQELRDRVSLTGFSDLDDEAEMVAYVGGDPVVLCYPVDRGAVDDPRHQEAAKFQAGAIAPGKIARIVWVSDGRSSYIFDMLRDRVLSRLPKRAELEAPVERAGQQPEKGPGPSPKKPLGGAGPDAT